MRHHQSCINGSKTHAWYNTTVVSMHPIRESTYREPHSKMELFMIRILVVTLPWILSKTIGNQYPIQGPVWLRVYNYISCSDDCLFNGSHSVSCTASVVLTQTLPAAPYVCRTGNITLRCQYDAADLNRIRISWSVHDMPNVAAIPGHTALPHTTTYQDLVVNT